MKRASFLRDLAMEKLLNAGPEAADRLEARAAAALNAENWDTARRLLRWRLEMRYPLEQKDRATIERLFRLMDEAEAKGIVGHPVAARPGISIGEIWPNAPRILSTCSLSASRRCSRIASLPRCRAGRHATALLLVAVADVVGNATCAAATRAARTDRRDRGSGSSARSI